MQIDTTALNRAEAIHLTDGKTVWDVAGLSDGILLLGFKPAILKGLKLVFQYGKVQISRPVQIMSCRQSSTTEDSLFECELQTDPSIGKLASLASPEEAAAGNVHSALGYVREALDARVGTRKSFSAAVIGVSLLTWVGLFGSAATFVGAAYYKFGIVPLVGSVSAENVQLIRAERQGIFFPYITGHTTLLSVGELIGVIEGVQGQPKGIVANCACYLGDFPVNSGATVFKGAAVARLIPPDGKTIVTAPLPAGQDWQINVGDPVEVEISGEILSGHVSDVSTSRHRVLPDSNTYETLDISSTQHAATLTVVTDTAASTINYGGAAEVRVLRARAIYNKLKAFVGLG